MSNWNKYVFAALLVPLVALGNHEPSAISVAIVSAALIYGILAAITMLLGEPRRGIAYDAATVGRILRLPADCSTRVPKAAKGEIVIYYGGWGLAELRSSHAGKIRMWQDQAYFDDWGWKVEAGYYRLRLPIPGSNCRTADEQILELHRSHATGWEPAPIALTTTALLVHLTETGNDLLDGNGCRGSEKLDGDLGVEVAIAEGRVFIGSCWNGNRKNDVWLAASQKC
jgi:hypothetical protein